MNKIKIDSKSNWSLLCLIQNCPGAEKYLRCMSQKSTQFWQVHSLVHKTNQYNYQKKEVSFRVGNVKTVHVLTFLWAWMFLIHDHVQVNLCSGQVLWPPLAVSAAQRSISGHLPLKLVRKIPLSFLLLPSSPSLAQWRIFNLKVQPFGLFSDVTVYLVVWPVALICYLVLLEPKHSATSENRTHGPAINILLVLS